MILTILIAFFSLIGLLVLHEFGHFLLAKRFGVKVEEFGIGYPPRIFGKKIGETVYSVNLFPFGAFIRIPGEIEPVKDPRSFSRKPIWQRAIIVLGGALIFWIAAIVILSIIVGLGIPTVVRDEQNHNLINPRVQIIEIAPRSPAERAGLRVGDTILKVKSQKSKVKSIKKVKEVQEFTNLHRGEEVFLTIRRGEEIFEASLVPRVSPPEGEGPMGVALVRVATERYPWYQVPLQGTWMTASLTWLIIRGWLGALVNVIRGLPSGVKLMGPVGVFGLFLQAGQMGAVYFLQLVVVISLHVALFNMLPIPAMDGGKLLFLGIEKIRGKPVSPKVEQKITTFVFTLLILLMVWITIKDIQRFF